MRGIGAATGGKEALSVRLMNLQSNQDYGTPACPLPLHADDSSDISPVIYINFQDVMAYLRGEV